MNEQLTREQQLVITALEWICGFDARDVETLSNGTTVIHSGHDVDYLLKPDGSLESM